MFTNPGHKLKIAAHVLFWIGIVGSIVLAVMFGIVEEQISVYLSYTETVFRAGYFFGFLIGGILLTYLESLCLYGFGELIENTTQKEKPVVSMLQDIESNLPNL